MLTTGIKAEDIKMKVITLFTNTNTLDIKSFYIVINYYATVL